MKIPYKLGELTIHLPSSWDDVTTGQMMDIKTLDGKDFFRLLAILSGVDRSKWFDCELSALDLELLTSTLEFIQHPLDLAALPMPSAIMFGGKLLEIPEDLNLKTFGQSAVFAQTIFDSVARTGDVVEVMDQVLAIYLQPEYTGKLFDADSLKKYNAMARETRVAEAYPVASFFISKSLASMSTKTSSSLNFPLSTPPPKSKPEPKALASTVS